MNSISYKIELEPLGDFFFGGETTFGEELNKNSFAKSNKFPQQSALLGMLRFELLKEKDFLPISNADKEKIRDLIGENSFDFERNSKGFEFGIIEKISPIFLTDSFEDFIPIPFDYSYHNSIKWITQNQVYLAGNVKSRQIDFSAFDVKKYDSTSQYIGTHHKTLKPECDFFESDLKIGINAIKSREGENDKEAFFKQEFIRIKNKRQFVFYVQLKENVFKNSDVRIVSLGGEQSMFRMKIKKAENTYKQVCKRLFDSKEKIVLISEAYVSLQQKEVLDKASDFAWSETSVFRNIKTNIEKTKDYDGKPLKSSKIHLIKRGSVFYYSSDNNKEEIIQSLKNKYLQQCGFNLYID